jgi:hypothetical protein
MNRFFIAAVLSFGSVLITQAVHPLERWDEAHVPQNSGAMKTVVFGNGTFVAGGSGGSILTSENGINWTAQDAGTSEMITELKFVNGLFFASVGTVFNMTRVSADGVTWSILPPVDNVAMGDITFGLGEFYATFGNLLKKSTDLQTWVDLPNYPGEQRIDFNGVFLASAEGPAYRSTDALQWEVTSYSSKQFVWSSVQNGLFFLTGTQERSFLQDFNTIYYSANGQDWLHSGLELFGGFPRLSRVAAGGPYYVAAASPQIYYTTELGGAWNTVNPAFEPLEFGRTDVAFGNMRFVAVLGGKILRSNPVTPAE